MTLIDQAIAKHRIFCMVKVDNLLLMLALSVKCEQTGVC